eukprot:CAMPEP_0113629376 /NCGR_PEP_ID=MMETSP0017_2-20120614/15247_1 /TAXON_ID=2856 /ORGANISM="Cylindrotheca closterium" /LENGTH=182 /DNA_ID=CAMNT_0000539767 /DNA_START=60 /DNA_END=608 /DNA_ORIENTATION=+ /assembly_acc=CAM_ASM_000147
MKLISSTLLAFSLLSADAFVIHHEASKLPSTTTTSLKDVGLQWGFDETGCRAEYYLETWNEHNKLGPQSKWAFDAWSGVSQTIFVPNQRETIGEIQQAPASRSMGAGFVTSSKASFPAAQTQEPPATTASLPAAAQVQESPAVQQLPPAEPAQPMPIVKKAAPAVVTVAAHHAAPRELPPLF